MKLGTILAIVGGIIIMFGTIFHFQGQSVIGPESSFMYSNPNWINYGLQIIITGIIVMISGTITRVIKRN